MHRALARTAFALLCSFASLGPGAALGLATQVWSGRTYLFVRADNVDWTLAQNQDRITSQVWITRAASQGIFNIAQESHFGTGSPLGTEWADGDAVSWPSLAFRPWIIWAASNPPATVGRNAVLHLIAADLYVDIRFTQWSAGSGGFAYLRGQDPATSVPDGSWGRLKALYR